MTLRRTLHAPRLRALLLASVCIVAAAACKRGPSREDAEQAVRTYLGRLVEAYRTADVSLVDPLVSEQQGLKLVGLIGVKQDAGVVLDAQLLDLVFTGAQRAGDGWVIETRERWFYRDRKIGSGEQVGQESSDAYALRYRFAPKDGKLILEDLEFLGEPVVGRKSAPLPTDARVFHGMAPPEEQQAEPAGAQPPSSGPPPAPPAAPPKSR
jgi:hypothetical protein